MFRRKSLSSFDKFLIYYDSISVCTILGDVSHLGKKLHAKIQFFRGPLSKRKYGRILGSLSS